MEIKNEPKVYFSKQELENINIAVKALEKISCVGITCNVCPLTIKGTSAIECITAQLSVIHSKYIADCED